MENDQKLLTLSLTITEVKILEQRALDNGFTNAQKYVEDIVRQILAKLQTQKRETQSIEHTPEDEERVKQRLAELGYLD